MKFQYMRPKLPAATLILILTTLLLSGCASPQPPTPLPTVIYPASSAPVQIAVLPPNEFTITNHTAASIYYQLFPSDLLPLIEWAACDSPAVCVDIQILPEQSETFLFSTLYDNHSEFISLFWWHIPEDEGQPNSDYFSPQLIDIPIP